MTSPAIDPDPNEWLVRVFLKSIKTIELVRIPSLPARSAQLSGAATSPKRSLKRTSSLLESNVSRTLLRYGCSEAKADG